VVRELCECVHSQDTASQVTVYRKLNGVHESNGAPALGWATAAAGGRGAGRAAAAAAAAAGLPERDLERRAAAAAMAMCCGRAEGFGGGSSPAAWARLDASMDSSCRSRVEPARAVTQSFEDVQWASAPGICDLG
jgi:hypothetical protein